MSESPSSQDEARQLINEATDFLEQQQKQRAERPPPGPGLSRDRAVLVALIAAVPILAIVVVMNFTPGGLRGLFARTPPTSVAAHEARQTLAALVEEIEAFGKDYGELPEALAEVGTPPRGSWTYAVTGDGRFRIMGTLYGQAVSYESTRPVERALKEEPVTP